jgi:lipopolysaccharide biosynthesis protein
MHKKIIIQSFICQGSEEEKNSFYAVMIWALHKAIAKQFRKRWLYPLFLNTIGTGS